MQLDKCQVECDASFVVTQYEPDTLDLQDVFGEPQGRSRFTKAAKENLRRTHDHEDGLFKRDPRREDRYKKCVYCDKMESFENGAGEPKQKFKFCHVCRACYCSAECQKEDWSVHKYHCLER